MKVCYSKHYFITIEFPLLSPNVVFFIVYSMYFLFSARGFDKSEYSLVESCENTPK